MDIYDDVEFDEQDLQTLRKQYHQLLCGSVEMVLKLMALQAEVRAWRDADEREDMLFNTLGEEDRNRILQAITNTDNTGALEDER
jgi:hypothetical protein